MGHYKRFWGPFIIVAGVISIVGYGLAVFFFEIPALVNFIAFSITLIFGCITLIVTVTKEEKSNVIYPQNISLNDEKKEIEIQKFYENIKNKKWSQINKRFLNREKSEFFKNFTDNNEITRELNRTIITSKRFVFYIKKEKGGWICVIKDQNNKAIYKSNDNNLNSDKNLKPFLAEIYYFYEEDYLVSKYEEFLRFKSLIKKNKYHQLFNNFKKGRMEKVFLGAKITQNFSRLSISRNSHHAITIDKMDDKYRIHIDGRNNKGKSKGSYLHVKFDNRVENKDNDFEEILEIFLVDWVKVLGFQD